MDVKHMFFDRAKVQGAMDGATHEAMWRACRFIRKRAQTSMPYVTSADEQERQAAEGKRKKVTAYKASQPGQPPRAVRPHPWIRQNLLYYYNRNRKQAVIGPVGFPGSTAPRDLEFGGRVVIRNRRRRIRRLGDGGEVRVGDSSAGRDSMGRFRAAGGRTSKPSIDLNGITVLVTYALLRTQRMVDRANRLNEQLYGPLQATRTVAPRPYMGPALLAEAANLPRLWHNSIRGG
jgi:hypothetical protein